MLSFPQFINNIIIYILQPIVVLMFVFALAVFMWGIVKFIRHSGTGENMDEGKQSMVWGVVGMLIMVSVYGIIFFVLNTFHLGPSGGSGFGY